jgi:methionyl-tRNA formyltransferase
MCDASVGSQVALWLIEKYPDDIGAVVTLSKSDIYIAASNKGIASVVFDSEHQLLAALRNLVPFDLGILAWWPKLISPAVMGIAKRGFINTHPSLLPYNRGKHSNFWALVGEAPFGVSLHYVDEGIDSGNIIFQQVIDYDWEDTGQTLYNKASIAMFELFKTAYPKIRIGEVYCIPQDPNMGTLHFAHEIDIVSTIDLEKHYTARELINLMRARTFPGHPACCFKENGKTYEITVTIKNKPL